MEPSEKRRRLTPTPVVTPTDQEITEKDLPLLANVEEVKVHHYLIQLKTNFHQKTARGILVIFLEWLKHPDNMQDSKVILDACCLNVIDAYSLKRVQDYDATAQYNGSSSNRKHFYRMDNNIDWFSIGDSEKLNFTVNKWSITISGWSHIPSVVRIDYETLENSPSLHWRPCNGYTYGENSGNSNSINKCAYTPAPPVNNRGLFPCQEPPSAMATWEILLEVENCFTPLVTSDEPGEVISIGKATSIHYFYTSIPLPMSTFAMVIGNFSLQKILSPPVSNDNIMAGAITPIKIQNYEEEDACQNHIKHPCRFNDPIRKEEKIIPVRLISLDSECISSLELERFSNFVFCSLQTCYEHFGPHPFGRLDLIIMPKCFPHLGFASPSMVFLSPCNFTGALEPLFVSRIPHEICHSWFGLLIGALDWTEEWLSEGFSTFCEDIVFKQTYQSYFPHKSREEVENELALRICLRFISLQNELINTDNELHVMSTDSGVRLQTERAGTAKNGLVPIKQFMVVHYYKGYLLLWHLAFLVGEASFLEFLKEYIWKYHGQLVSSDIFLNSFYEKFKCVLDATEKTNFIESFCTSWLESEKLPPPFDFNAIQMLKSEGAQVVEKLPLFKNAINSVKKVQKIYKDLKGEKVEWDELQSLTTSEFLLLLDLILSSENGKILKICYKQLVKCSLFDEEKQNPDIMHRWCELIVSCRDYNRISVVERFLENNMAMGVYLYGELMISEKKMFQKLARNLFYKMEELYDMGGKRLLKEMLF